MEKSNKEPAAPYAMDSPGKASAPGQEIKLQAIPLPSDPPSGNQILRRSAAEAAGLNPDDIVAHLKKRMADKPSAISGQRGILNPNISREEEIAQWNRSHEAMTKALQRREEERQARWRKTKLSRDAKRALGPVDPFAAWQFIRWHITEGLEDWREASEDLARRYELDGIHFRPYASLDKLLWDMEIWNPKSSINHLLESNPGLDLRHVTHQPYFTMLKAVLEMLLHNDAYN